MFIINKEKKLSSGGVLLVYACTIYTKKISRVP